MTWASRTGQPGGKTSPEELAAAAHSSCFALALRLGERKAAAQRLTIAATVTLDEVDGTPTIVSSRLRVRGRVPGLDVSGFRRRSVRPPPPGVPDVRRRQGQRDRDPGSGPVTADRTVTLGQLAAGALEGLLILATAVWTGGLVAIFVVARVARHTLRSRDWVAFFRGLGRACGPVGGIALAMALGCGVALLYGRAWDGTVIAATVIAVCLVLVTASGVGQARRMTRLRHEALTRPGNWALAARVRRAPSAPPS